MLIKQEGGGRENLVPWTITKVLQSAQQSYDDNNNNLDRSSKFAQKAVSLQDAQNDILPDY